MLKFSYRNSEMQLEKGRTALVLADMQNEFLEEKTGTYYEISSRTGSRSGTS
ncbi:hypothetical protein ACRAWG_34930 [Methylobacterium sp. P31]